VFSVGNEQKPRGFPAAFFISRVRKEETLDETERQEVFVRLVGGRERADRLQWIRDNSYPCGTECNRISGTRRYKTKEEVFRLRAKREGFKDNEISSFLEL